MGPAPATLVLGHGFADAAPFPVPPQLLLLGGAALVMAATAISSQYNRPPPALARTIGRAAALVLRVLALLLLVAIVVPAAFGPSDAAANPSPRLLFTVGWAGLLLISALVGPLWARANPLRLLAVPSTSDVFARHGVRGAAVALALFTVFEQVAEPSPLVALIVVALYVVGTAGGALLLGIVWFRAVDPVETASRLIGRLAPVGRSGRAVVARRVRAGVAGTAAVPGMAAFLGVLAGGSLYDALEPSGGFGMRLLLLAVVLGVSAAVAVAAARPAVLAPALIPVAAAHLGTHYLAPLLEDTQVAVIQASDPLGRGWDLLGLTGAEFVAEPIPALAAQALQVLLLVGGHALAMVSANDIAARRLGPGVVSAALFPIRAGILTLLVAGLYLWLAA